MKRLGHSALLSRRQGVAGVGSDPMALAVVKAPAFITAGIIDLSIQSLYIFL